MKTFTLLLLSSLVWFPSAAMACATCYGVLDASQTRSMNMANFTLLGVIATVLGLFAAFFVFLMIRAKTSALNDTAALETGQVEVGKLIEVNAHE